MFIANGNSYETIRIEEKDREAVVYGAFEGLRLWLKNRLKKTESPSSASACRHIRLSVSSYYFDPIVGKRWMRQDR